MQGEERIDLNAIARKLVSECNGDRDAAAEKLMAEAGECSEVAEAIIAYGVHALVRQVAHHERSEIEAILRGARERGMESQARDARSGRERNRQAQEVCLMMFPLPLPGQPRLGDASREQVEASVEFYRGMASKCATNAGWLDRVARAMQEAKSGERVRDRLTEEQIREMEREAR